MICCKAQHFRALVDLEVYLFYSWSTTSNFTSILHADVHQSNTFLITGSL
jgi:hypothetical protein